jgi:hypothetical protein
MLIFKFQQQCEGSECHETTVHMSQQCLSNADNGSPLTQAQQRLTRASME